MPRLDATSPRDAVALKLRMSRMDAREAVDIVIAEVVTALREEAHMEAGAPWLTDAADFIEREFGGPDA